MISKPRQRSPIWWVPKLYLTVCLFLPACSDGAEGPLEYDLVLLQTNDRHSHWLGSSNCDYDPATTGDGTEGGAARWASLVKQARADDEHVLLLDAGDFTMGTMFAAADNGGADLNMMKALGFDAAALGNHEFDWGPQGLAQMVQAAQEPTVPLLCANIRFDSNDPGDDALEALYGPAGQSGKRIHPYVVRQLPGGPEVGIFGLMGMEAAAVSNARPARFSKTGDDMVRKAQAVVDKLRDVEQVDVVVLLAHLGLTDEGGQAGGETAELAKKVEGIDVILSGHYHTKAGPLQIACEKEGSDWSTLSMEAHAYGRALGRYRLEHRTGGRSITGELLTIDDSIAGDADTSAKVDALIDDLEQSFLPNFPHKPTEGAFLDGELFQTLAQADFDLLRHANENNNLGYLLADAVAEATAVELVELVAISNGGDLRASLERCADGTFDLSDAFNAAPLGIGPDGLLGYPVVVFYLQWGQLKMALEATVADEGWTNDDYMLSLAGLRLQVDTSKTSFSRVQRIVQYDPTNEDDQGELIFAVGDGWVGTTSEDLVKISTSLYIAQFLASFSLKPLDEYGNPVIDEQGNVDFGKLIARKDGNELKMWYLLAEKLASFTDKVPDQYNDDTSSNLYGPYWRRMCDLNPDTAFGHNCP